MPSFRLALWLLACLPLGGNVVSAQNYPSKVIRIATSEPGGGSDFAARFIAQALSVSVGQQVIVDNRGGPGGAFAAEFVAKSPPDGYSLLLNGPTLWLSPFLRDNVPYDVDRDFVPITLATTSPNLLVVHPSIAAKSVKELIALAKAKPGALNFGTSGTGSSNHLSGELFKSMAGINIVRINYKGAAQALNDLIGSQLQLMFPTAAAVAPHVKSGRLTALAVTSARPSALAPGVPTVAASGLPGYESSSIYAIFAPTGTSASIIKFLNHEIVVVLNKADAKEKFLNTGIEVVGSSPEQLAITVKAEMQRMGKVIRDAGIRDE